LVTYPIAGSKFVFPGAKAGQGLSNMALLKSLWRPDGARPTHSS
jgi:hypothetical protein